MTTALGGEAAGPEALVDGLRWGVLACAGFAVVALVVVLFGMRGWRASEVGTRDEGVRG